MYSIGTLVRVIWRSSRRATVFVVGVVLVAVGLVMFVTPGPGIVLVVAGLALLATEFAWAEHLLDKAKEQAAKAGQSAQRVPGVAAVTSAAGRLVPRRWRRVSATRVTVTTSHGVVTAERTTVVATEITPAPAEITQAPADHAAAGSAAAGSAAAVDAGRPPRTENTTDTADG